MTFAISIDAGAWRQHCDALRDRIHAADAALIPVIKGNGYGLGQALLAREAQRMGLHAIAVGTVHEVASVADDFTGDIVVMEPVDPRDHVAAAGWAALTATALDERVIRTVSSAEGLDLVLDTHTDARVILEARTAMRRFGFDMAALQESWQWARQAADDGRLRLAGLTVHLPTTPSNTDLDELLLLADRVGEPGLHLLVSHVDVDRLAILRRNNPGLRFSLRIGTALWLGLRGALHAHGTVLAVHRVRRGDTIGYNRRPARRDGHVAVVSGGTAHGIGLEAPSPARTWRQRLISIAAGVLNAGGRAKSPFSHKGNDLWFAEPPHQQVSMLWVPEGVTPPQVGDRLDANVRFTTTRADRVDLD